MDSAGMTPEHLRFCSLPDLEFSHQKPASSPLTQGKDGTSILPGAERMYASGVKIRILSLGFLSASHTIQCHGSET